MDLKKSSDEIITELFDSINTVNASMTDSTESEDDSTKKSDKRDRRKVKKSKKNKKSKKTKEEDSSKNKRHRKKKKKRKKHKRKVSASENDSDEPSKKKKSKRKSSKHRNKDVQEESSVVSEQLLINTSYINRNENVPECNQLCAIENNSETSLIPLPPDEKVLEIEMKTSELCDTNNKNEDLSVNSLKVADVFVEDLIESGDQKAVKSLINPPDKPKMAIKISDLRNSTVLELAEEQAKLQADLHEDGEIVESSDSSRDIPAFREGDQGNGEMTEKSPKNGDMCERLERGNIISSQQERKLSELSVERQISTDSEKRITGKHKRKSRDRDASKDHSPQNSKLRRQSLERYSLEDSRERKKSEYERVRDRRRSREKKGVRSRSREGRSMSTSKSKGRYRSRSKDRRRSKSRDRKRSKSRDKFKSKDSDKSKVIKHTKDKDKKLLDIEDILNQEEQLKCKHHLESKKSEGVSDENKNNRRSKSKDRRRERSRSKESQKKKRERKSPERRGRSRDRHSKRSRSSRSRSRSKHKSEYFIDKSKLLEIARKNALNMIKQGQVNIGVNAGVAGGLSAGVTADVNKVAAITAGGKTVDELTDFCKLLSQKEATGQESISSESSSDNENERPFHHPFQLKERPNNIIMNIRNCASLPVKTHQEKTTENAQQLRLQFPVSSGQQHRKTESEWIPVSSTKNEPKAILPPPPPAPKYETFEPPPLPVETEREKVVQPHFVPLPPPPPPPPVFIEPTVHHTNNYELGNMISERLSEIRHQYETSNQPYQQINCWPGMENQAGLFTGSTGARVLSAAELASGQQAWAKKDQLICAQPVSGGMGMSLLQKMGWKPGEGLGKHSEGSLEPLKLQVKMDKRGLVCAEELPRRHRMFPPPPPKDIPLPVKSLEGKHPVSLLVEYCSRRHLPPPIFTVISEEGPAHKKNFVFKVTVNGTDFQPPHPSPNKKQAKSEAATLCLKSLNILPTV